MSGVAISENGGLPAQEVRMDAQWWRNFIDRCDHFSKSVVIPGVLPDEECERLAASVTDVVRSFSRRKDGQQSFRVWIDNEQKSEEYVTRYIYANPPLGDEDLVAWAQRVFGDRRFGIIINGSESYSEPFCRTIARYVAPLMEEIGVALNGVGSHVFIGNYGFTPIGIHQDSPGADVIHFHIGPGGKDMYNWEPADYVALTGTPTNYKSIKSPAKPSLETMLPYASKYTFGKGDLYFMPWSKYHIGYSDEISIGVTVWLENLTRKEVVTNMIEGFKQQYVKQQDQQVNAFEKDLTGFPSFSANVRNVLQMEERKQNLSFVGLLEEHYRDQVLNLHSNAGLLIPPPLLKDESNYVEKDYRHLLGKSVRVSDPCRIYHKTTSDNKLVVFTRARRIVAPYHAYLVTVIEKLNTAGAFRVEALLAELPPATHEGCLYFLSCLYNRRGIEVL